LNTPERPWRLHTRIQLNQSSIELSSQRQPSPLRAPPTRHSSHSVSVPPVCYVSVDDNAVHQVVVVPYRLSFVSAASDHRRSATADVLGHSRLSTFVLSINSP